MSLFDVLQTKGTWALIKVVAALNLFLLLHLLRLPFVVVARVIEFAARRVDRSVARLATTVPVKPVNQFFADPTAPAKESCNVYA
ncbi:hypothetical protein ABZ215_13425 [Amycolatopsis sp. NPDC006131]|uniref:hypothetical protein n=1 Tax=Amycolatopsis sp. NPDC006131 TaxID=3156731 RepID=UPI0033B91E01